VPCRGWWSRAEREYKREKNVRNVRRIIRMRLCGSALPSSQRHKGLFLFEEKERKEGR
jgi:hypothetical protein